MDDPGWQGDDGVGMAGHAGGTPQGVLLGGLDVRDALDQGHYSEQSGLSYFRNSVSEFPLTYRGELIDKDSVLSTQYYSVSGAKRLV